MSEDQRGGLLNETIYQDCLGLIHELTGITVGPNRHSMIQGRLRRRMREVGILDFETYLKYVKKNESEKPFFIDLVTTNETYFFRTPRVWDYLSQEMIPEWHLKNPGQIFKVWSAACSSGEEAHSLAIVCEDFKEKNPSFQYQILATDISQEMVALASAGLYSGRSIESFREQRAALFQKYMKPSEPGGAQFHLSSAIRSRIQFRTHNLFQSLYPKEIFQLVLLRNVLIYFTREDQEKVLANLSGQLAPQARLIIGESESLAYMQCAFSFVMPLVYGLQTVSPKQGAA